MLGGAAVVAALVFGLVAILSSGSDEGDGPSTTEIFAEPAASIGIDPFMGSIVPDVTSDTIDLDQLSDQARTVVEGLNPTLGAASDLDLPDIDIGALLPDTSGTGGDDTSQPSGPARVVTLSGAAPGLYGGTNELNVCDPELLINFLESNADKAAAWAEVHGIDTSEIRSFVGGLTDVVLNVDTRVTNHGFNGGRANPISSVLQAGTAVLVDKLGLPVVRCKCGNPLAAAEPLTTAVPEIKGTVWQGFDVAETVVIAAAEEVIEEFALDDVISDQPLFRIAGAAPEEATRQPQVVVDTPPATTAPSTTAGATTTTSTTTTTTTTTQPRVSVDATAEGTVSASSSFDGFPAGLSVDGSAGSSWFSAGSTVDGDSSTYQWSIAQDELIESVTIVGNGGHATPDFRTGFGFAAVTVQVRDGTGATVYEESFSLPGSPDPTVTARPGVVGRSVVLIFAGHEDPICGGFSELSVVVAR